MIITDKLIMLCMPKNGSTFIRNAFYELYGVSNRYSRFYKRYLDPGGFFFEYKSPSLISNDIYANSKYSKSKHNTYCQIPRKYNDLPVSGCIRDPKDRVVSLFYFNWWKGYIKVNTSRFYFSNFLDFHYSKSVSSNFIHDKRFESLTDVGPQTLQFIRFFAKDINFSFERLMEKRGELNMDDINSDIEFVFLESINKDLYDFLKKCGYKQERIKFILKKEKLYKTESRNDKSWQEVLNPNDLETIMDKEKILFNLFPQYKV